MICRAIQSITSKCKIWFYSYIKHCYLQGEQNSVITCHNILITCMCEFCRTRSSLSIACRHYHYHHYHRCYRVNNPHTARLSSLVATLVNVATNMRLWFMTFCTSSVFSFVMSSLRQEIFKLEVALCYDFKYLVTTLLTPWSRVLLEKLTSNLCS